MPVIQAIRASVLTPLVQKIDEAGGRGDTLLATHGILRSQLSDPYALVPMSRYIALFEDAAFITGNNFLGAHMGQLTTPGDLGPPGILFSISPTIRSAFDNISRYVAAVQGGTTCGLYEAHDKLVWTYQLNDPALGPHRQDSEFTLSVSCQLVRSCFMRNWRPSEIHFEHAASEDTDTLKRIFRVTPKFGQSSNRLIFDRAEAERVFRSKDAALTVVLERHINDILNDVKEPQTISDKVKSIIAIYIGHKRITLNEVAAELGISSRTLQRQLANEGTSLRTLIERHRQHLVATQLEAKVKKGKIAETLGYADSTVLWRASRKWQKGS